MGQPINKSSNDLASFIGCLAQQVVPITLESWHKVTPDIKNRLWICDKVIFAFLVYVSVIDTKFQWIFILSLYVNLHFLTTFLI